MVDDKSKRMLSDDDDEIEDMARQSDVTAEQVRELIKATGRDRAALLSAAKQLRALSNGGPLTKK